MHIVLWVLQGLGALLYGWSGYMKLFRFDQMAGEVPAFAVLPKSVWIALGVLELVCVVGLIMPGILHWRPSLTVLAAGALAVESLLFIWVHAQTRELVPLLLSATLGLVMAFVAYGRATRWPLG